MIQVPNTLTVILSTTNQQKQFLTSFIQKLIQRRNIMALHKTKKSTPNRVSSPSHSPITSNESFAVNGFKKFTSKKQNYHKFYSKLEGLQETPSPKKNCKIQQYLINESKMMKKTRKSIKHKSLSVSQNQWAKISSSKIEDNKQRKSQFNHSHQKICKSPYLKQRQRSSELSQHKNTSKKQVQQRKSKNTTSYVRNKFAVNEQSKLRKKKYSASKNSSKTYCQQMRSTTIIHNNVEVVEPKWNVSPFYSGVITPKEISYNNGCRNQQQINNKLQQNQLHRTFNQNSLSNIRVNSQSLLQELKNKERKKLAHITTGYEQILSSLATVLSKKSPSQLNLTKNQLNPNKSTQKRNSCPEDILKSPSQAETQAYTSPSSPTASPKGFKKPLNSQKLKHRRSIETYDYQSMDMEQEFSKSWKKAVQKKLQF